MIKVLIASGSTKSSIFKASKGQQKVCWESPQRNLKPLNSPQTPTNNPCIIIRSLKMKPNIKKLETKNSIATTNWETFQPKLSNLVSL